MDMSNWGESAYCWSGGKDGTFSAYLTNWSSTMSPIHEMSRLMVQWIGGAQMAKCLFIGWMGCVLHKSRGEVSPIQITLRLWVINITPLKVTWHEPTTLQSGPFHTHSMVEENFLGSWSRGSRKGWFFIQHQFILSQCLLTSHAPRWAITHHHK